MALFSGKCHLSLRLFGAEKVLHVKGDEKKAASGHFRDLFKKSFEDPLSSENDGCYLDL